MKNPMSPSARLLLWFLLLLTAVGRLWVATADYKSLIANDVWQDDAFYYLQVARNVALGRGFTFDGHTPTNGFPLFQLLLVPVMYFSRGDFVARFTPSAYSWPGGRSRPAAWCLPWGSPGGDRRGPDRVGDLGRQPVFHTLQRERTGDRAGDVLRGLAGPPVRAVGTGSGRRQTLAVRGARSSRGGGCVNALDLACLLLGLALDWLQQVARRSLAWSQWRGAALAGVVALGTWMPWGYASNRLSGHWLPLSGPASRQIALNYGWTNLERTWFNPRAGEILFDPARSPAYYADVATKLATVFVLECPLFAPLRVNVPFTPWPPLNRYVPYLWIKGYPTATAVGVGVLAFVIVALARVFARRLSRADAGPAGPGRAGRWARISLCFSGRTRSTRRPIGSSAGTWRRPCCWRQSGEWCCAYRWQGIAGRGRVARVGLWAGAVLLVGCELGHINSLAKLHSSRVPNGGFLASWQRLGPSVGPTAKIGAFQAGIIGYFSQRDVVNLDGKVNPAAYSAIRNRRLYQYVREQGIDYIMDWEWILYCLCLRYAPTGALPLQCVDRERVGAGLSLLHVGPRSP